LKRETEDKVYIKKLINGCESGNEIHQEKLYKHFYSYALSVSRLYSYSTEDAVDILNDSFLKIFTTLEKKQFDKNKSLKFYLRRVIINSSIDSYRRNKKHRDLLQIEENEPESTNVEIISKLQFDDIINLLDKLPEMHRIVFNLYEIQGFKHVEIASKLEITESSSRVFLSRAKKELRILIEKNF
jgi:RNA polymerase sigma-70 factor (ECF subfamily)